MLQAHTNPSVATQGVFEIALREVTEKFKNANITVSGDYDARVGKINQFSTDDDLFTGTNLNEIRRSKDKKTLSSNAFKLSSNAFKLSSFLATKR